MTATNPANSPSNCPECGAPLAAGAEKCWLCAMKHERPIGSDRAPTAKSPQEPPVPRSADPSPTPPGETNLNRTFSLSSVFLWTTLLAVILGVVRIAPGLGIGLAILSLPAALFTVAAVGRRKRRTGESMRPAEKIATFAASLGTALSVAALIVVSAFGAFLVACFGVVHSTRDPNRVGLAAAIIFCIVAGIILTYFLVRRIRKSDK